MNTRPEIPAFAGMTVKRDRRVRAHVTPAKAGVLAGRGVNSRPEIPAFAGMTVQRDPGLRRDDVERG